jgi:hypothetical protein
MIMIQMNNPDRAGRGCVYSVGGQFFICITLDDEFHFFLDCKVTDNIRPSFSKNICPLFFLTSR